MERVGHDECHQDLGRPRLMHGIHLVTLGSKVHPAVLLTRATVAPRMTSVTIAPITSTAKGLSTEVPVGPENGIDHASVINCDNIATVDHTSIGSRVGYLTIEQEAKLAQAMRIAFDLL